MPNFFKSVCVTLIVTTFLNALYVPVALAESVDDKFTQISPQGKADGNIHGQSYGKILMRVIMFGAVSGQGVHYVPEGTDLLFAILYAGGKNDTTKLNGITIRRRNVQHLLEIDLEDIMDEGGAI